MLSKDPLLLNPVQQQNIEMTEQSQINQTQQTHENINISQSKILQTNVSQNVNINVNQALSSVVQQNRPGVQQQVANFAQQTQNAQINFGGVQDSILSQYNQYRSLKSWFSFTDSALFKAVGIEFDKYREDLSVQEKLDCIRAIRNAAQNYLEARVNADGSEKKTRSGRNRLNYMKNLMDTLTREESILEISKWDNKDEQGAQTEAEKTAEKERATEKLRTVEEQYEAVERMHESLKDNVSQKGTYRLLSAKLKLLEYQKAKLSILKDKGTISPQEIYNCAEDYANAKIAMDKKSNEQMYTYEKASMELVQIRHAYFSTSFLKNNKEVERTNNSATKAAKASATQQSATVSQAATQKTQTFETLSGDSLAQLDVISNAVSQKNDTVNKLQALYDLAKAKGAHKKCLIYLKWATSQITAFSKVDVGEVNAQQIRKSHVDYNRAIGAIKDAYILAEGELKDNIGSFLTTIEKNSKGNLDIKGKTNIVNHLDREFNDQFSKKTLKFEKSFDPLFINEPSVTDIIQGELGDCYLLAELSTIVRTNPDIIKNAMVDEGNTVAVRFFNGNREDIIRIEKTVVRKTDSAGDYFATGNLWVQMMEKAFVAYKCSNNYSSADGSCKVNNITNLLIKNAQYDTHNLSHDQNKTFEDRLFIHATGSKIKDRKARGARSMDILRTADKQKKASSTHRLSRDDLQRITNKQGVTEPDDRGGKVENDAYNYIVKKVDENIATLRMEYSEMDMDTLQKQIVKAKNSLINEINVSKPGAVTKFVEDHSEFLQEKGNTIETLKQKVENTFNLLKGFIETTIADKTGQDNKWDDYSSKEEADYNAIKAAIGDKQLVRLRILSSKDLHYKDSDNMKNGIFGNHAYSILDTKETVTSYGYKKKMVLIKNPHGYSTATYKYNQTEGMMRESDISTKNAGLFWFDIRDIESCCQAFHCCKSNG